MIRRIQSLVLALVLCLPATSLAVLYTCTMDGLTRMANCEDHPPAATLHHDGHGAAGGAGGCERLAPQADGCCEIRVVTESLETAPLQELPSPVGPVVYVSSPAGSADQGGGFSRAVDAPPWRGPPLYQLFASFLI